MAFTKGKSIHDRKSYNVLVWSSTITVVVSAAMFVLSALLGQAFAADKLTMRLDWSPQGMHAPIYLAVEKGWFKAANLDVAIEDGNGSVITVQLVGAGKFDIGHASLSTVAMARGRGVPVISIAGFVRKGDMGVIVPAESGWKTVKDLEGKKVAYTAGSLEGPFINSFFGASKNKVELVNVDAATKVATYLSGNADAVISTVPYVLAIVAAKRPSKGMLFSDVGLELPDFGLFASNMALKEKGDAIRRLTSVIADAWNYIIDGHIDEGVQAIIKNRSQLPLDADVLKRQIKNYLEFFYTEKTKDKPIGFQSKEDWSQTIKILIDAGLLDKGSRPEEFFTNEYITPHYIASLRNKEQPRK